MARRFDSPRKTPRPPSRKDKRVIGIYVPAAVFKQFKQLALDTGMTGQDLGLEAFNMLFEKYRQAGIEKPQPAPAPEPMKRFTIDVPADLHVRIKTSCAERGTKMADELRQMLEQEFT